MTWATGTLSIYKQAYTVDDAMPKRIVPQAMDFHRCVQYCASQGYTDRLALFLINNTKMQIQNRHQQQLQ